METKERDFREGKKRLTTGFTCNFGKDVRKVRDLLYAAVGMRWRYGNDKGADIQEIQMRQMGVQLPVVKNKRR